MIELKNVYKYYGNKLTSLPAIDNLSIRFKKGEICTLIGPSGCGKSTILRMINRMIEPTDGSIFIDGINVMEQDPDRLRMGIGYVIQQIGLLPHKTVEQNISIIPTLYNWDKKKIQERVVELLELVGLNPDIEKDKYPAELSGGQMQRVGVARALAVDPPIMLMDEPFGAVDPIARGKLQDEFLNLQKKFKKTICFVTHDIDEAIKMGDRIAIFNKGQIVQYDIPSNILTKPANTFVENFIGEDRFTKIMKIIKVEDILAHKEFQNREDEMKYKVGDPHVTTSSSLQEAMNIMIEKNTHRLAVINEDSNLFIKNLFFQDIHECIRNK